MQTLHKGGMRMRKNHKWFQNALAGLLIGIACILPGASGGVLAVAFGLYRPMLDAIMHLMADPKRHLRFLLSLGVWIAGGIVLGAFGLSGAMARHERLMLFLFTGLIAGGIPDLMREAEQNRRFQLRWLLSMAAGVLVALPLCLVRPAEGGIGQLSHGQAFVTGILEGVGTVIPGISTSIVLLRLGWYQAYLHCVSAVVFPQLLLMGAGFAVSAFACMLAVQRLFERHTGHACYAVLGFLLVSVATVFPGFTPNRDVWAQLGMLVIGITVVRLMGRLESSKG